MKTGGQHLNLCGVLPGSAAGSGMSKIQIHETKIYLSFLMRAAQGSLLLL
jgi:hypothetical protein